MPSVKERKRKKKRSSNSFKPLGKILNHDIFNRVGDSKRLITPVLYDTYNNRYNFLNCDWCIGCFILN